MSKSKFVPSVIIMALVLDLVPDEEVSPFGESREDFLDCVEAVRKIVNGRKGVRYYELVKRIREEVPMVYGSAYFDVPNHLIWKLRMFA